MPKPTDGMRSEAQRGLDWRSEYGRGGTEVGIARARDIVNNRDLSSETVKRMYSFFSRHEVDKKAEGFSPGEDGYPSNGRIAWALWGGDAGFSWSKKLVQQMEKKRMTETDVKEIAEEVAAEPNEPPEVQEPEPAPFDDIDDREDRELPVISGTVYRTCELRMLDSEEERVIEMSVSSTTPVEREFGYEVLAHSAGAIDLDFMGSGRAPLLLDHDPRQQIGVIERAWMDGEKLRARVRFSRSAMASEIYNDVRDGIRGNVSIGYQIKSMSKTDDLIDGRSVYRVDEFKPLEVSMVSIPADSNVGVGRSHESVTSDVIFENSNEETQMKVENVTEPDVNARQREIEAIINWGERHNQQEFANQALKEGWSGDKFRDALLERLASKPMQTVTPDLTEKEKRGYSLLRAIEAQRSNNWSKAGFERELSEDIQKRVGREPRGFYVPDIGWGQRTVTYTGGGATGSNIVPEDYRGDSFIDALISVSILGSVGATTLNGLQGDVAIPKMTTSSAAAFIDETGASDTMPNNEPAFGQVTMSPKTLANRIAVSRRLMIQTDPSVEQLVRNNMVREFAAKIDRVALNGSGSNSEPTGILQTGGIGAVLAGGDAGNDPLTYGDVVNIWTEVSADNALLGSLNWVTHPRVVGKLMQTLVASSTDSRMVMENTEQILGYSVAQTTQMPGAGDGSTTPYSLLFGNFSDLLVGFFSALDILVDPYHAAANATTNLYFYQDIDIAVARVESFSASQNVTV